MRLRYRGYRKRARYHTEPDRTKSVRESAYSGSSECSNEGAGRNGHDEYCDGPRSIPVLRVQKDSGPP